MGWTEEETLPRPCACLGPHLAFLLSQPLKHVGVEFLLPRDLLADPLVADSQLGLGGFVVGVELQDLLEISPCQVEVIHCQVRLSPAEKAFLIVAVQFQGLMTREETGRPQFLQHTCPRLGSRGSPLQDEGGRKLLALPQKE